MTGRRVEVGGAWIDRSRPIGFTFDGRELTGFEGDTLASALLANGVDVVCRSPILGRPRGIVSAGVEESSAFVEVSEPRFEPIVAATMVNLVDGLVATGRPGVGVLPFDPPPTTPTLHRHAHVEVLVRPGQRLSENDDDVVSHRLAVIALAGPDRASVLRRYDEAVALMPFELDPIPARV